MKKNLKRLCLLLATGITSMTFAQSTWYFGTNAGITFTGGTTAPASGSAMTTGEGSAVLVDRCNTVVAYTDGVKVWNGSHTLQTGISALSGDNSSTQSAVIVPVPVTGGVATKAFIFTVNAAENGYGYNTSKEGLRATLVSISGTAPATTLTVVNSSTDYNKLMTPASRTMAEKLSVTDDGSGGYWVVGHGVNVMDTPTGSCFHCGYCYTFITYHITTTTTTIASLGSGVTSAMPPTGLTPVQSFSHPTGTGFGTLTDASQLNGQGQLKIGKIAGSTTQAKIAFTLPWVGISSHSGSYYSTNPIAQIYTFDLGTGVVSAPLEFNLGFSTTYPGPDGTAYGVEFSPSGQYLYVTSTEGAFLFSNSASRIYQYDITAGSATAISATKQVVKALTVGESFGALQIGPDNKIYAARVGHTYIDVINTPDVSAYPSAAAVGYTSGISIAGTCASGLPNKVLSTSPPAGPAATPTLTVPTKVCQGTAITVTGGYSGVTPANSYWEIYTSNAAGNPIDCSGAIVGTTSACYDFYNWYAGAPGVFTFPGSASLACGKYYTIKLALTNGCPGSWSEITKTLYVQCNPRPTITSSIPNPICYGSAIDLCVNYTPGAGVVIDWLNAVYNYPSPADNVSCLHTVPTDGLLYTVNINDNGCHGSATYTTVVESNNPNFSLAGNLPAGSPYYTITATPVVTPPAGVSYWWEVVEVDPVTLAEITGTKVTDPCGWWVPGATTFKAYDYITSAALLYPGAFPSTTCPLPPAAGTFGNNKKYKVTYGTWTADCPWQSTSATIQLGHGPTGSNFIIDYSDVSYDNPHGFGLASSVNTIESQDIFNVYPNPSTGLLTIDFSNQDVKNIQIYDSMGKLIYNKESVNEKSLAIDIVGHSKGIYFLNVISNNKKISKKIIIE